MNRTQIAPALAGIRTRCFHAGGYSGQGRGYMAMVVAALMSATMIGAAAPERPRDPWVFRCVLDENPRMVVIALHDDLWVAYDAMTCSLYKAWKGGVKFDGAVYTTVHGPQPTSVGEAYFAGPESDVWMVDDGNASAVDVLWRGYSIMDDQVTLNYELVLGDGQRIAVRETPEVDVENESVRLRRRFVVGETPGDVEVRLVAARSADNSDAAFIAQGDGSIDASGDDADIMLHLPANSETEIEMSLQPLDGGKDESER